MLFYFLFSFSLQAQDLKVLNKDKSFQITETKKEVSYKTHLVERTINKKNCPSDFLEDFWVQFKIEKEKAQPFEITKKEKKEFIKIVENKKTYFVSPLSSFAIYLEALPNTIRNFDLREKRLCKK